MFYGCTREGRDGEWCPTEIHGGNMTTVDGRWGYCGQGCGDMLTAPQAYSQDFTSLILSLTAEVKRLRDMVEKVYHDEPQVTSEDNLIPTNSSNLDLDGCSSLGHCAGRCGTSDSVCSCDHLCGGTVECCCDRDLVCKMTSDGMVDSTVVATIVDMPANSSFVTASKADKKCIDEGSCSGRCGGGSVSDCWCDEMCDSNGDCCCDREDYCQLMNTGWKDQTKEDLSTQLTANISITKPVWLEKNRKPSTELPTLSIVTVTMATCRTSGSCSSRCGGGSEDDCWCNEVCAESNACCCDKDDFCDLTPLGLVNKNSTGQFSSVMGSTTNDSISSVADCKAGTCHGACGGLAESGCWCDQICEDSGDCCCDRNTVCFPSSQGWVDRSVTSTQSSTVDNQHSTTSESGTSVLPTRTTLSESSPTTAGQGSHASTTSKSGASLQSTSSTSKSDASVQSIGTTLSTLSSIGSSTMPTNPTSTPTVPEKKVGTEPPATKNKFVMPSGVPLRCKTIAGPAIMHGCVFPFIYKNKTFTTCPGSTIRGSSWCSTKVDSRQRFIPGFWGFCGDNCHSVVRQTLDIPAQTGQLSHTRKPVLTFRDFASQGKDVTVRPVVGKGNNTTNDEVKEVGAQVKTNRNQMLNESKDELNEILAKPEQLRNEPNQTDIGMTSELNPASKPTVKQTISTASFVSSNKTSGLDEVAEMLNPRVGDFLQGDRGAEDVTVVTTSTNLPPNSEHLSTNLHQTSTQSSSTNFPPISAHSSPTNLPVSSVQSTSTNLPPSSAQSSSTSLPTSSAQSSTTLLPTSNQSTNATPTSTQSSSSPVVFVTTGQESVPYIKTTSKKPQCLTWAGPEKGQRCVFPFTYRNKTFDGCTEFWRQKSWWCATKVDSMGNLEGGKWGLCQDNCPHDGARDVDTEVPFTEDVNVDTEKPSLTEKQGAVAEPNEGDACLTVSGIDVGKTCKFPFTYHGRTYSGCTYNFGVNKPWCSTETDQAGHYIPGRWGYCSHTCPGISDRINECVTVAGPRPHTLCVFPFMSEGVLHWGCTRNEGRFWCPTMVDDHVEVLGDNWGWCKERCKEEEFNPPCENRTRTSEIGEIFETTTIETSSLSPSISSRASTFVVTSKVTTESYSSVTRISTDLVHTQKAFTTESSDKDHASNNTAVQSTRTDQDPNTTVMPLCSNSGSCRGRCGGGSDDDDDCWCDELCDQTGDCCCDKDEVCGDGDGTGSATEIVGTDKHRMSTTEKSQETFTADQAAQVFQTTQTPVQIPPETTSNSGRYSPSSTSSRATSMSSSTTVEPLVSTEGPEHSSKETVSVCSNDGSCIGRCGGGSDHDCWCDTLCDQSGDCCCDREEVCGSWPESTEGSVRSTKQASDSLVAITYQPSDRKSNTTITSGSTPLKTTSSLPTSILSNSTRTSSSSSSVATTSEDENSTVIPTSSSTFNMSSLHRSHYRGCLQSGSCEAMCGGGSDHTCWCDSQCLANGDCCCDKDTHCPDGQDSSEVSTEVPVPVRAPIQCLPGSCIGRCGGGSDHDCWCDDLCSLYHYADCCCDLDPVCGVQPVHLPLHSTTVCNNSGSCTGRCGGGSDDDCWCDDLCEMNGDCCCDKKETCATEPVQDAEVNMSSTEAYVSSTKQDSVSITDQYNAFSTEKTTTSVGCISGCRTDSSGPKHDRCCVFPFIYEGETHSTCIEVDGNKSWCSTKVDQDGVFIESEWGYCGDNCVFDTPLVTMDNQVTDAGHTSKPTPVVTEGISEVDMTSPTRTTTSSSTTSTTTTSSPTTSTTTISSPSTTVEKSPAVSSTSTTTALPTTTKTTKGPVWVPYVFVYQAKPSKDFLSKLPPAHSVVKIPPTHYDPVRALLGNLV